MPTGPGSVSTPAVAAAGVGALVLWAALKGVSVTGGLRSLLTGKQPSAVNSAPITGAPASAGGSLGAAGAATGSAIADRGLSYVGSGMVYGWGASSPQACDCSGLANLVIGHDLGLPIPGSPSGRYSGHGPATMQWALYGTGVPRSQVQAGDLIVWPLFHMGIAINSTQMVNAPGPNGTPAPVVSSIDGGHSGPFVCRRPGATANTSGRA